LLKKWVVISPLVKELNSIPGAKKPLFWGKKGLLRLWAIALGEKKTAKS